MQRVSAPILVPLDGSELAERALPLALGIARRLGKHLLLASAPQVSGIDLAMHGGGADPLMEALPAIPSAELLDHARREATTYLGGVARTLRDSELGLETVVRDGTPDEVILELIAERTPHLTVMATHGRGGLRRWAFGSVADRVMRASDRPVLVVRAASRAVRVPIRHLLVPLDGSSAAECVAPVAGRLAAALDARVTLAHVMPGFERISRAADRDATQIEEEYRRWIDGYLTDASERLLEPGTDVRSETFRGDSVAEALLARERRGDVDLVAISTHGRGGAARAALGSVADRIVRGGEAPVLVVRRGREA